MSVFCNIFYFITISRVHWIVTSDIVFLLNEVAVSFIKLRGEKVIKDLFQIKKIFSCLYLLELEDYRRLCIV